MRKTLKTKAQQSASEQAVFSVGYITRAESDESEDSRELQIKKVCVAQMAHYSLYSSLRLTRALWDSAL